MSTLPSPRTPSRQQKLAQQQQQAHDLVAALEHMPMTELRTLWPQYFTVEVFSPSPAILRAFLAYRIQEQAFGGLSRSVRNRLESIAKALSEGRKPVVAPPKPKIRRGTRLLRSWHGEIHEVTVHDDGFLYRSRNYGSLSEIARKITGVPWSGPLFFGLKKRSTGQPDVESSAGSGATAVPAEQA